MSRIRPQQVRPGPVLARDRAKSSHSGQLLSTCWQMSADRAGQVWPRFCRSLLRVVPDRAKFVRTQLIRGRQLSISANTDQLWVLGNFRVRRARRWVYSRACGEQLAGCLRALPSWASLHGQPPASQLCFCGFDRPAPVWPSPGRSARHPRGLSSSATTGARTSTVQIAALRASFRASVRSSTPLRALGRPLMNPVLGAWAERDPFAGAESPRRTSWRRRSARRRPAGC